jgi:hypothetical protein
MVELAEERSEDFPREAAGIFSGAWLALIARLSELIKGKSSP